MGREGEAPAEPRSRATRHAETAVRTKRPSARPEPRPPTAHPGTGSEPVFLPSATIAPAGPQSQGALALQGEVRCPRIARSPRVIQQTSGERRRTSGGKTLEHLGSAAYPGGRRPPMPLVAQEPSQELRMVFPEPKELYRPLRD